MYAESPQTIILAQDVHAVEATNLVDYCERLQAAGQQSLTIDLADVVSCDRPALARLSALQAGCAGMRVTMRGAHWAQFLETLQDAALEETDEVTHQVRTLIGHTDPVCAGASRTPFTSVARTLQARVRNGDYRPGERLPPLRELAAEQHVATGTVVRAVAMLKRQGILTGGPGRGAFVTPYGVAPDTTLEPGTRS